VVPEETCLATGTAEVAAAPALTKAEVSDGRCLRPSRPYGDDPDVVRAKGRQFQPVDPRAAEPTDKRCHSRFGISREEPYPCSAAAPCSSVEAAGGSHAG
jgi:hypothetical protein